MRCRPATPPADRALCHRSGKDCAVSPGLWRAGNGPPAGAMPSWSAGAIFLRLSADICPLRAVGGPRSTSTAPIRRAAGRMGAPPPKAVRILPPARTFSARHSLQRGGPLFPAPGGRAPPRRRSQSFSRGTGGTAPSKSFRTSGIRGRFLHDIRMRPKRPKTLPAHRIVSGRQPAL